jgi:AcrR family transcriptional regulator
MDTRLPHDTPAHDTPPGDALPDNASSGNALPTDGLATDTPAADVLSDERLSAELWPDVQPGTARRLMLAGLHAFAERGYHATTTRDIASAAGMSPAGLYVYFPSKLALLHAITRSGHEQMLARLSEVGAEGAPPPATVAALVAEFVAWHARRHTVARVVQYELHVLHEREHDEIVVLRRHIEQLFRDAVTAGVDSGDFDVPDVRTATLAVISLGIDVARWYGDHVRTSPTSLGDQYAELALRMLGARPPGSTTRTATAAPVVAEGEDQP